MTWHVDWHSWLFFLCHTPIIKEQRRFDALVDTSKTTQIQYTQFLRTSKSITHALPKSQACSHRQIYAVKQPAYLISLLLYHHNKSVHPFIRDWREVFPHSHEKTLPARLFCICICLSVTSWDWSLITEMFYSNVTHILRWCVCSSSHSLHSRLALTRESFSCRAAESDERREVNKQLMVHIRPVMAHLFFRSLIDQSWVNVYVCWNSSLQIFISFFTLSQIP